MFSNHLSSKALCVVLSCSFLLLCESYIASPNAKLLEKGRTIVNDKIVKRSANNYYGRFNSRPLHRQYTMSSLSGGGSESQIFRLR
jgi:hypothetical protein